MISVARTAFASSRSRTFQLRRSFVSSVLLSRTWENKTVAELKQEAKSRGLSLTGNKATLILRIQDHENAFTLQVATDAPPTAAPTRRASTAAPAAGGGVAPGLPPPTEPVKSAPSGLMSIHLPEISAADPEPAVQVPYVPDFWGSSTPKESPPLEGDMPKILVVAGATTHPGASHNTVDVTEVAEAEPVPQPTDTPKEQRSGGLADDVTEDLGLPPAQELKKTFWKLFS
ncbi:hypothetical protein BDN72DRAFT_830959, partial [Pluteus cervinus]